MRTRMSETEVRLAQEAAERSGAHKGGRSEKFQAERTAEASGGQSAEWRWLNKTGFMHKSKGEGIHSSKKGLRVGVGGSGRG